ncbi:HNH endonuclease [Hymenobacter endophyticus]|uniref:HNH endonuclease n=1 Tax=Hymenobacter endophyticus TaxID=3076335 RepID=A0ABU3TDV4_9BACT|nr:HNH endonuclease [Hymenobacter endophyticus]MDU0369551.1 HNH endonuclease [Hymenobacter endophyticus]
MTDLTRYTAKLTRLKLASSTIGGMKLEAPYKPALLLAVLEGIEEGSISDNQIRITPELIAAFKAYCRLLSPGPEYSACPFHMPFFHLQSSGFWHLQSRPGRELVLTSARSVRSFGHLRDVTAYAYLDAPLWELVLQPLAREEMREALLARYFPLTRQYFRPQAGQEKLDELGRQMLEEPAARYRREVDVTDETEVLVRSAVFGREVLRAYSSTCAVSGLQLLSTTGAAPLLDACHIVPWSVSHDDTIGNGLALCPNLHRAFDRHLFWIDTDYRVRITEGFGELGGHAYGVQQFNGKQLQLPKVRKWWPQVENLVAQREAYAW